MKPTITFNKLSNTTTQRKVEKHLKAGGNACNILMFLKNCELDVSCNEVQSEKQLNCNMTICFVTFL